MIYAILGFIIVIGIIVYSSYKLYVHMVSTVVRLELQTLILHFLIVRRIGSRDYWKLSPEDKLIIKRYIMDCVKHYHPKISQLHNSSKFESQVDKSIDKILFHHEQIFKA